MGLVIGMCPPPRDDPTVSVDPSRSSGSQTTIQDKPSSPITTQENAKNDYSVVRGWEERILSSFEKDLAENDVLAVLKEEKARILRRNNKWRENLNRVKIGNGDSFLHFIRA